MNKILMMKFTCIAAMLISLFFMFTTLALAFYISVLIGGLGFILFSSMFTYWAMELGHISKGRGK